MSGLFRFGDLWVPLSEGPAFDDYTAYTRDSQPGVLLGMGVMAQDDAAYVLNQRCRRWESNQPESPSNAIWAICPGPRWRRSYPWRIPALL